MSKDEDKLTPSEAAELIREITSIDQEVWRYLYHNDRVFAKQLDELEVRLKEAQEVLKRKAEEKALADKAAAATVKSIIQDLTAYKTATEQDQELNKEKIELAAMFYNKLNAIEQCLIIVRHHYPLPDYILSGNVAGGK